MEEINYNEFRGKRILLIGGLGFVGANLLSILESHAIEPIILDYLPKNKSIKNEYFPFNLENKHFFNVDIRKRNQVIKTVKEIKPDYLVHLASMTNLNKDFKAANDSVEVNIKGTLNVLESLKSLDIENFVFLSTSDVYGDINPPFKENQLAFPASPYSVSKLSAEMYILLFHKVMNLPLTILRSFNLFGKYQKPNRFISYAITEILNNRDIEMTYGEQKREFNYVENLVDAIILALINKDSCGKIINIGCGESISIKKMAQKITDKINSNAKLNFGAVSYRKNEIWDMYCNNSLAKEILGWESRISLDEGIDKTIKWYKELYQRS